MIANPTSVTVDTQFLARYNQLLEARADAYPSREYPEKAELLGMYDVLADELTRQASARQGQSLNDDAPFNIKRAVFICGFPKSGTTMMPALLDSHPSLLVIPGDTQYLDIKRKFEDRPLSEIITRLRHYMMTMVIQPLGLHPFWLLSQQAPATEPYVQLFGYYNEALRDASPTFDGTWAAMLRALRASLGTSANTWVEKTPSNEHAALALSYQFPQAKFIHVIRQPAANLASLKKMKNLSPEWEIVNYQAAYLRRSMRLAQKNQATLGKDRYFVVRYEDLTDDTETHMRHIADFLDIPFNDALTQATVFGFSATPNSSYQDRHRQEGAPLKSHEKWREVLTDWELDLLTFQTRKTLGSYEQIRHPSIAAYWRAVQKSNQHGKPVKLYRALRYFLESYL